jgi:hypothetical protein
LVWGRIEIVADKWQMRDDRGRIRPPARENTKAKGDDRNKRQCRSAARKAFIHLPKHTTLTCVLSFSPWYFATSEEW